MFHLTIMTHRLTTTTRVVETRRIASLQHRKWAINLRRNRKISVRLCAVSNRRQQFPRVRLTKISNGRRAFTTTSSGTISNSGGFANTSSKIRKIGRAINFIIICPQQNKKMKFQLRPFLFKFPSHANAANFRFRRLSICRIRRLEPIRQFQ